MRKLLLLAVAFCFMCGMAHAQNLDIIESELQEILNQKSDDMISVTIMFKSQIKTEALKAKAGRSNDKSVKREIVVSELKDFASSQQSDVMSILQAEAKSGKVADINSLWIVNAISCKATGEVIYMLSSHPDIAVMSYNKEMQLLEKKSTEKEETRTDDAAGHILQVQANEVWKQGYTGKNVIVAVLDSGSNIEHYDLKDHLWIGYADTDNDGEKDDVIHGWNFVSNNSDIKDDYSHGTHCAGIVCGDGTVGNTVGIAPDATLMTVKIANRAGGGTVANMISGVQFAVDNGADVLSMSLGFKTKQLKDGEKETIRKAFDNVLEAGVIVCAAAGNDGEKYEVLDNIDYPAACPSPWLHPDQKKINTGGLSSVICVGSVNGNNNHVSSSSKGPVTWQDVEGYNDYPYDGTSTLGLIRPDISAPGDMIYSLKHDENNKYKLASGTSQATPCVAGVIALMLEKNSNLTPAEICEILETTATNKPNTKNNQIGSGVVNALNAVNSINSTTKQPYVRLSHLSPNIMTHGDNKTINITLANDGNGVSENTKVSLTTTDQYITITNPNISLGNINAKSSTNTTFDINIDTETPNGHFVTFTLTTTSGSYTWVDNFTIKINSYAKITLQSSSPSIANAGEETILNISMINKGTTSTTKNTDVRLTSNSQFVNIENDVVTLAPMNVNDKEDISFNILFDQSTPDQETVQFVLQANPNNDLITTDITYEFEQEIDDYGYPTDGFNGWTTFDNSPDGKDHPWWHSSLYLTHRLESTGGAHSGKGQMMSEAYCQASMQLYEIPIDNFLVSPKIKATANSKMTFFARRHSGNYQAERFAVMISEKSNNNASDFIEIKSYSISTSNWKEYEIDLKDYAGKEIYVAIRHNFTQKQWEDNDYGFNTYVLHIDDVIFHDVIDTSDEYKNNNKSYFNVLVKSNPLPAPENVAAETDNEYSINVSWDAVNNATSYNVYRDGVKITNTTNTSYTDIDLKHNTEYCYKVSAVRYNTEYEQSEEVCAKTLKKNYSAGIKDVTPTSMWYDNKDIDLSITFVNDGNLKHKYSSIFTITSDDTYVTISKNTAYTAAPLAADEEITKHFTFALKENIPNNHKISFNANIKYEYSPYTSWDIPFDIVVKNDPNTPKNIKVTTKSENSVTLSWDAVNNDVYYNIYRDGELVGSTAATTYYDGTLQSSTEYKYQISSVASTGESERSKEVDTKTNAASSDIVLQSFTMGTAIGQNVELTATMINKGSEATPEATTATLTCKDPYVTIISPTADLGSMAAGATATATFIIKLDENIPSNYNINFDVTAEYEGEGVGNVSKHYTFDNGFEGWTTSDLNSDGETWYHSSNSDSHSPSNPGGSGHLMNATYCNKHRVYDANDIIWSPEKIKIGDNTKISFHVRSTASTDTFCNDSYYIVYNSTSQTNPSNYNNIFVYNKLGPEEKGKWNFKEHDLSSQSGNEVWVGIWHEAYDSNADGLCIDEITISNIMIEGVSTISNTSSFSVTANPSVNIFNGTGAWDIASNWSKSAVPSASDNVIISGNATIENGDVTVNTLLIYSGSLTVEDGVNLTITDELSNTNANAFIINDGAQLFQNNDNVAATFIKNIRNPKSWDANHTEGWQFIASPVNNAYVLSFIPQTETDYDLFKYDGTKEMQWVNYKGHSNEFDKTFQLGTAYLASYEAETTTSFSGILNNESSFNFDVTYDSDDSWANFHLLGNPFSFNMDWSKVALDNVYNGFATIDPATGSYVVSHGEIPVGDGFFVEAIGVNPTLSYGTQSKSKGEEKADYINVIASGKQGSSNLIVRLDGEEETGFSKLENINPTIADIYVVKNSRRYSILGYDENTTEVELFFAAKEMGTYSISLDVNGKFQSVTLVDRMTGIETNMLLEDEYAFVASSSDNPNRFFLRLDNSQQSTDNSHFAYVNNGDIVIYDIEGNAQINIFDAMGRCVYQGESTDAINRYESTDAINRVPTGGFSAGVYVIQKVDENGVNVQKIIL